MRIEDDIVLEVGETVTVHLERAEDLDSRIRLNPVDGVIQINDNDGVLQLLCTLVCRFFSNQQNKCCKFSICIGRLSSRGCGRSGKDILPHLRRGSANRGVCYRILPCS